MNSASSRALAFTGVVSVSGSPDSGTGAILLIDDEARQDIRVTASPPHPRHALKHPQAVAAVTVEHLHRPGVRHTASRCSKLSRIERANKLAGLCRSHMARRLEATGYVAGAGEPGRAARRCPAIRA